MKTFFFGLHRSLVKNQDSVDSGQGFLRGGAGGALKIGQVLVNV